MILSWPCWPCYICVIMTTFILILIKQYTLLYGIKYYIIVKYNNIIKYIFITLLEKNIKYDIPIFI